MTKGQQSGFELYRRALISVLIPPLVGRLALWMLSLVVRHRFAYVAEVWKAVWHLLRLYDLQLEQLALIQVCLMQVYSEIR